MGGWVGGDWVGCFLCNQPRPGWSRLPTAHLLGLSRISKVSLVTEAAASRAWDQIFLFCFVLFLKAPVTWVSSALTYREVRGEREGGRLFDQPPRYEMVRWEICGFKLEMKFTVAPAVWRELQQMGPSCRPEAVIVTSEYH